MPISSATRKAGPFTGDGITTQYGFTFKVFAAADLAVTRLTIATGMESTLVLNTDYTVSLNANQDTDPGGKITLPVALANTYKLVISSAVDYLQPTDLTNQGGFYPSVITDALDRACIQIGQLKEQVDRSAKLPITNTTDAEALVADIIALVDDKATLDAVAADLTTINAVHANKTNIDAVAGNATNINAVNANKPNIDAVAGNATNINTVAADTTAINTVAANIVGVGNFADVYQGAKASDPATRNDSSALQEGDIYFNTTTKRMRVYGSVWVDAGVTFDPTIERFSGTGAQTAFTLAADPGSAIALIVDISGIKQVPTVDYTVSGTTLTFTTAPPSGTNNIAVQSFGSAGSITVPANDSISTVKVQNGAITNSKLNSDVFSIDRTWSGSQRGAIVTDNDLSFDMNEGQNFSCTPTSGGTLTFTNITAGQSGFIKLVNGSNYAISKNSSVKSGNLFLETISVTGTYLISYWTDGTNIYATNSGALT